MFAPLITNCRYMEQSRKHRENIVSKVLAVMFAPLITNRYMEQSRKHRENIVSKVLAVMFAPLITNCMEQTLKHSENILSTRRQPVNTFLLSLHSHSCSIRSHSRLLSTRAFDRPANRKSWLDALVRPILLLFYPLIQSVHAQ